MDSYLRSVLLFKKKVNKELSMIMINHTVLYKEYLKVKLFFLGFIPSFGENIA